MSKAIDALRCYDADLPYTPQNRFGTPAGFRDEDYFIPFTLILDTPLQGEIHPDELTPMVRNFPIQMDDDVPFIWQSIIFPAAGLTKQTIANVPTTGLPLFMAWRDTRGNALSDGLVLTMGAWCQSGAGSNGAGFPLDEPVECDAGGCLTVDYQGLNVGGTNFATLLISALAEALLFTAVLSGADGNGITVTVSVAAPSGPLVVGAASSDITIVLAADAGGNPISTFAQVQAALVASGAVTALVTTSISGSNPAELFPVQSGVLGGGGTSATLSGLLYGKKRYPLCVGEAE